MLFPRSGLFFLIVLVCVMTENATQLTPSSIATAFHEHAADTPQPQLRTPDSPPSQPGVWPKQGIKRQVDVTQLKIEAQDLRRLVEALPVQIDSIGNGVLPKELIENLKKIEKISKRIRSEVT
jgi:hypothetical protein